LPLNPSRPKLDEDQLTRGVLGLIFFITGLATLLFLESKVTLACDRTTAAEANCILRTETLIQTRERVIPVASITGAVVDVSHGEDGDTYRVVLQTTSGRLPLANYYSSGNHDKEQAAGTVNSFLMDDTMQKVYVTLDDRIFMAICSGIFAGTGALMLIQTARRSIHDPREGGLELS
jgi:hypothetical protein